MTAQKAAKASPQRDADATRERILVAAKQEFSTLGLGGARVDTIALKAKANKRMIYHYFGNKENLFTAVLEAAYLDIRNAEKELHLETLEPEAALQTLVEFTWRYYLENPEFLRLVNSENLFEASHLKQTSFIDKVRKPFVDMIRDVLDRGVKKEVFRKGVDPVQLLITIAAVGYYYLTNQYTGSLMYGKDLMTPKALDERLAFNLETIMRLVKK